MDRDAGVLDRDAGVLDQDTEGVLEFESSSHHGLRTSTSIAESPLYTCVIEADSAMPIW